jgi:dienelactone hydrolase
MLSHHTPLAVPLGGMALAADLFVPDRPRGLVILADSDGGHGAVRLQTVARWLEVEGFATLIAHLLTAEELRERAVGRLWCDSHVLGRRVDAVVGWARQHGVLGRLTVGLFGMDCDAAAALVAAASRPHDVAAVVTCGGRPDRIGAPLSSVVAPTLMLVGGLDPDTLASTASARRRMHGLVEVQIVHGANPFFDEPGPLESVAARASEWFAVHLDVAAPRPARATDLAFHR